MEGKAFETAKIFDFIKEVEYSSNGIISKRILEKQTGNITLFSFDQGQKLSEHTAPFDAFVQVIEGKAEIIIDGKTFNLVSGQSIIMPANVPHAVNATEQFKMMLTMIKA
jgi:quercetin dioxygenase-like cupin family protein